MSQTIVWRSLLLLLLLGAWGCSGDRFPVLPVSGTVTFNGKPLANATISFEPVAKNDDGVAGEISVGRTDAKGHFTLTTTGGKPGAVIGSHRVRITTARSSSKANSDEIQISKEVIPPQYNTTTELQFEVSNDGPQTADFQLTS